MHQRTESVVVSDALPLLVRLLGGERFQKYPLTHP